jgi:4-hydroxy-tetrahydrodipicolinate synthase
MTLHGVLPVVQTPFSPEGLLDESTLAKEVDWLFDAGADGITFAMVSEVLRLSDAERRRATEVLCAATAGRGPVVISVCAESTVLAVGLAQHAQQAGAEAVIAVPPLHVPLGTAELRTHFEAIADSTPLVMVVQDASGYVGPPIPTSVYGELFDRYGDRVMFKPEAQPIGPRLSALLAATGGRGRVFEGTGGAALMETFPRGLVGTMPGADLCWAVRALWDALAADDLDLAYAISLPLGALIDLQPSLDAFVAVEKYLLYRQGVLPNTVRRAPVEYELDDMTIKEVERLYQRLVTACGR